MAHTISELFQSTKLKPPLRTHEANILNVTPATPKLPLLERAPLTEASPEPPDLEYLNSSTPKTLINPMAANFYKLALGFLVLGLLGDGTAQGVP